MTIFDDIRKDREAAQTHGFHWIGETLMAKEYDEVVELCHVDWSGLDECEAEHKRRIARVPRLERIALEMEQQIWVKVGEYLAGQPHREVSEKARRGIEAAIKAAFRAACGEGE